MSEHEGECCESCLQDMYEGYYDLWEFCCCRSEDERREARARLREVQGE